MALNVEIIDFTRPVTNSKNLYVSGIFTDELDDVQITSVLHSEFSSFGLVYEVQVLPGNKSLMATRMATKHTGDKPLMSYYAFVKFYSHRSAQKARLALNKTLTIGTQQCKVSNAVRMKESNADQTLYSAKCQELANFYLGFNGWTSSVRRLEEDKDVEEQMSPDGESSSVLDMKHGPGHPACLPSLAGPRVRFFCVVELAFPQEGLSTQGVGAWDEVYCLQDHSTKITAMHKARKRSLQRALEHAFSNVLLVVVTRGDEVKVSVEIDTTKTDELTDRMRLRAAEEQILQVTELGEEPLEDPEDDNVGMATISQTATQDLDDVNLHLLQELGNDYS